MARIEFTEWTPDGHLRHSKFIGLREDKDPKTLDETVDNKKDLSDQARKEIIRRPVVPLPAWGEILIRLCILRVMDKTLKGKETNTRTPDIY